MPGGDRGKKKQVKYIAQNKGNSTFYSIQTSESICGKDNKN